MKGVLGLVLILLVACAPPAETVLEVISQHVETPIAEPIEVSQPAPTPEDIPDDRTIIITNKGFSPKDIRITVGTTVTWKNNDRIPHTLAISTPGVNAVRTKLQPGLSFSNTFTQVGRYQVYDVIMKRTGFVVVADA